MTVKTLIDTDFDQIIACFLAAFDDYFVKMPTDPSYYRSRWGAAKVDFKYSYGMFDGDELVGFIIHAIDHRNGKRIAFNTGTGVLPAYRGKRIVKSIYEFALKNLVNYGIETCLLEVITENKIAIQSYQSIGFKIERTYHCFSGKIKIQDPPQFKCNLIPFNEVVWHTLPHQALYAWDHHTTVVSKGNYQFYNVTFKGKNEAFFIINPENGTLAQCDILSSGDQAWPRLFAAIEHIAPSVKINNVDSRLKAKIAWLKAVGLVNTIDQYEMKLEINQI